MTSPELLAPVGDWNMLRAAVHNGADAVYIGMPGFNARGRAATLELSELGAMIDYAHLYGVRVLLAFNVLIFERELAHAEALLRDVLPLHPDALIVQDIGLVRLIKLIAPTQVVHASTQMTVTCAEAIAATDDLDLTRYVLGREVSLEELALIKAATGKELEVFVHGALCVSYSGQCLTSESLGGRSANRGQCAQSCRLPYGLLVDGEEIELGDRSYLVSPKDLCSLDEVPELKRIGIASFKIEGRLKSPEYVASTVQSYRSRIDGVSPTAALSAKDLQKVYSRGFFSGWMHGVDHQRLVDGRYSAHQGLHVGHVLAVGRESVTVESSEPFNPGDGVVFVSREDSPGRFGASLFGVTKGNVPGKWILTFSNDFEPSQISVGAQVFINSSPALESLLMQTITDKALLKKIPIDLHATGAVGAPLSVIASDPDGNQVSASSNTLLTPARSAPLTLATLSAELGALSGTVFSLQSITSSVSDACFIHQKELKEIRRSLVTQLQSCRTKHPQIDIVARSFPPPPPPALSPSIQDATLTLLIREYSQIDGLGGLPLDTVYLDFEFGKEYSQAAARVRDLGFKVGIATTRVMKPGEQSHLKVISRVHPDAVLVRNLGALHFFRESEIPLVGDFSLNVSNSLSAGWLHSKGLSVLTPSHDLNKDQLEDLLHATPGTAWELVAHHYMPAFHMEHCVFAAFLSSGSSYRDCGRPCEKHRVEMRDTRGNLHPLKADAECRNTMFHGLPQSSLSLLQAFSKPTNVRSLRIEALFESPEEIKRKVVLYNAALRNELPLEHVMEQLGVIEKVGVTTGQLFNIRTHSDRKKPFASLSEIGPHADPGLRAVDPG